MGLLVVPVTNLLPVEVLVVQATSLRRSLLLVAVPVVQVRSKET